ncbi:MAG: hypothetical protein F9K40_03810 [Kofleriaceae bacterium]|nr:MAG: hypothetical protein F9K40_03810 [Kofleriaceae bacterium]MBZ0238615.1 hypothetical protein [Kofleriaceae bacterium]
MYATVADLRGEGVTDVVADDARLELLLDEATRLIDQVTGQFFEPRTLVLRLPGTGAPSVYPPYFPIRIDELSDWDLPLDVSQLDVSGAPVLAGNDGPRITRVRGFFSYGARNVRVVGRWGYTEHDGSPEGRTPLAIRRATILLALRWLVPLGENAGDGRRPGRVVAERTRDQAVEYSDARVGERALTDEPEVDGLLWPYVRHSRMGAA